MDSQHNGLANSSKALPLIKLITAALGLPASAGLAYNATEDIWWTVGTALLYAVLALVVGFASKVWIILENTWVKRAAQWVDFLLQNLFSRYRKKYRHFIVFRYRNFDVKGLGVQGPQNLALEHVYVQLRVAPQPLHATSADPIPKWAPERRQGRHLVWDYLSGEDNLVVIGAPGSGKSTMLQHMTLALAQTRAHRVRVGAPRKLPLLLALRNHARSIKEEPDFTLADAAHADASQKKMTDPPPSAWFHQQLDAGRCLVLLDGLDEVADATLRKKVVTWVGDQMATYHYNRFVITSRPHGYKQNVLSGVSVLEVSPFDRQQVHDFIHNWYFATELKREGAIDEGVKMMAREGAEDLLRRLQDTATLSELAVNPLLLTMIANVHKHRSSLPGRRVELYREICDVLLGKRKAAHGLEQDLTPAQKQSVLRPLAHHMMTLRTREIPLEEAVSVIRDPLVQVDPVAIPADFLQMLHKTSGLLLERENGLYSFAHLTFQEYLAAEFVSENKLVEQLATRVDDGWWHETIRLYVAQADATPVVAACLEASPPSPASLALAVECAEEALRLDPALRTRLTDFLEQGIEDDNPETRKIVAEALLAMRLKNMVRIDEDTYVDPEFITHAEYQLFLDETRQMGDDYRPYHWDGWAFPPGSGRTPVVGVSPGDSRSFCTWLSDRDKHGCTYRLPAPQEAKAHETGDDTTRELGWWEVSGEELSYHGQNGSIYPLSIAKDLYRVFPWYDIHVRGGELKWPAGRWHDLTMMMDAIPFEQMARIAREKMPFGRTGMISRTTGGQQKITVYDDHGVAHSVPNAAVIHLVAAAYFEDMRIGKFHWYDLSYKSPAGSRVTQRREQRRKRAWLDDLLAATATDAGMILRWRRRDDAFPKADSLGTPSEHAAVHTGWSELARTMEVGSVTPTEALRVVKTRSPAPITP